MIYACKTSASASITVVLPYLPYSKQCRMRRRSAIGGKLVAEMICKAGICLGGTVNKRELLNRNNTL